MDAIYTMSTRFFAFGIHWVAGTVLLALLSAIIIWIFVKRNYLSQGQGVAVELLFIYIVLVLVSTVFSREAADESQYELLPFWSYLEICKGNLYFIEEIVLNVLMLVPLGFLFPMCTRSRRIKYTVLSGLCFSTAIEVLQLITKRGLFEFDDVIHNTLGAAIGYGIYRICIKIYRIKAENIYEYFSNRSKRICRKKLSPKPEKHTS